MQYMQPRAFRVRAVFENTLAFRCARMLQYMRKTSFGGQQI